MLLYSTTMWRRLIPISLLTIALGYYLFTRIPYSQKHIPPPANLDNKSTLNNPSTSDSIPGLVTPPGFEITYFAQDVVGARSLTQNQDSSLIFVGTRGKNLYAVVDQDKNGVGEKTIVIRSDLDTPNGVAYKDGDLYVAEVSRILRFPKIDSTYTTNPAYEVVYDQLPKDKHHGWKYIAFGPDGLLYIPIGAPCNVCEDRGVYSRMITLNLETKEVKTYATGIRNTVGFDWSPSDRTLYFTDNGRDLLGDDLPPDELNHAPKIGLDFGFPRCHGNNLRDPQYGTADGCALHTKPLVELGPHVAALGMKFYRGQMFPPDYKHKIVIAEHGSWNRRDPIGYRLTLVDPVARTYSDFVTGWLVGGESWGRPVDLLELLDGSLLISDDLGGSLYRLSYTLKP